MLDDALKQLAGTPEIGVKADLTCTIGIVIRAIIGIFIEAAKQLSSMNAAKVIVGCCNEKEKKAVAATGKHSAELNLGRFSSVDRFERGGGRLYILVINAGIAILTYEGCGG